MNYNELKKQYDNARKEQLDIYQEIKRLEKECSNMDGMYSSIKDKYAAELVTAKASDLEQYKQKMVQPFEEKLLTAQQELEMIEKDHETALAENNAETMLTKCSTKQDILDEVRSVSKGLKEKLIAVLGEQFCNVIMTRIESTDIDIQTMDLDNLIDYFNDNCTAMEKYATSGNKIDGVFQTIATKLLTNKSDDQTGKKVDNLGMTLVAFCILLLLVVLTQPFVIIYTALLFTFACFYVIRSYNVFKAAIVQKAVENNIDAIDALIKQQIQDEIRRREQEINETYLPTIQKLEDEIARLKQTVMDVSSDADNTFQFDDSQFKQRMESELNQVDSQKSALLVRKRRCEEDLKVKTDRVTAIQADLNNLLNGLQEKFLFGVGKDIIFNPIFLFDIDSNKAKPEYFRHPETSTLFLYDDIDCASDFIRLLSVQLRAKLNPFNLNITVYDTINIGKDFFCFTDDSDAASKRLYNIVHDEETEKQMINELVSDLMSKQRNIGRGFGSIKEYNEYMVSINSLTESYKFIFILDPTPNFLGNTSVQRIITNGFTFGIYCHIFKQIDDFVEKKEDAMRLLNSVERVYVLQNGKYFERAKDYVIENIIRPEEK